MPSIVKPNLDVIVDKHGRPTAKFFQWLQLVSDLDLLEGTTTPEGSVEARKKRLFIDTASGALYIKTSDSVAGDRTKGWVLV